MVCWFLEKNLKNNKKIIGSTKPKSKFELIADNSKLHLEVAIKILKIQELKNEVEDLKKENIVLMLKNEKLTSKGGK